jgi:hypothetical protein
MLSTPTTNIIKLAGVSVIAFLAAVYRDSIILLGDEYLGFLQYYITLNILASIFCEYLQNNYYKSSKSRIYLVLLLCSLLMVFAWHFDSEHLSHLNLIIVACAQSLVVGRYVVNGRYYLMNLSIIFENLCIIFVIYTQISYIFEVVILYRIIFTLLYLKDMPKSDTPPNSSMILFLITCLCTLCYALLMFFLFNEETSEDVLLYRYVHYLFAVGLVPLNIIIDKLKAFTPEPRLRLLFVFSIILLGLFFYLLKEIHLQFFCFYLVVYYAILTMVRLKSRL